MADPGALQERLRDLCGSVAQGDEPDLEVGQRLEALGHVGVNCQPGEALQHVFYGLVEVPVEVLAVESHAQRLGTESGERLRHTRHRQGETVT